MSLVAYSSSDEDTESDHPVAQGEGEPAATQPVPQVNTQSESHVVAAGETKSEREAECEGGDGGEDRRGIWPTSVFVASTFPFFLFFFSSSGSHTRLNAWRSVSCPLTGMIES